MIRQFITRLLRICLLLLIVVVIAIGTVLLKPIWLSDLIEQQLANYGISAEISTLTADFSQFSKSNYRLNGNINAQSACYGFNIDNASVQITTDWQALLQGKAFITDVTLGNATIDINRPQLMQAIKQAKSHKKTAIHTDKANTDTVSTDSYQYLLPKKWQITDSTVHTEGQTLSVKAHGQAMNFASVVIKDSTDGVLSLHYIPSQHLLSVAGKTIDLQALTGQSAKLQQLQSTINTDNWLSSRAEGQLISYLSKHAVVDKRLV